MAPIRNFENLYGHGFRRVSEALERDRLLQSALPELSSSYQKAMESLKPELNRMRDLVSQSGLHDLSNSYRNAMESLKPDFNRIRELGSQSTYMASIADAHSSLSRLLSQNSSLDAAHAAAISVNSHWQEVIESYSGLGNQAAAIDLALKTHYTSMAGSAFLAQERLLQLSPESLGVAVGFAVGDVSGVRNSFVTLTDSYRALMQSFEENELLIPSFPPIISQGPSIEVFTNANTLMALSSTETEEPLYESRSQTEYELQEEIEASLDELLAALDSSFRDVWKGAKVALYSDNPDRMRHVVVSLRELVNHVLHRIAPNDEIKRWTTDHNHFHDGRPTRAARVLYICRGINNGPFTDFISADVKASIECINLFQRGTHELLITFSEHQIKTLVVRTESLLRLLLLTHRATK